MGVSPPAVSSGMRKFSTVAKSCSNLTLPPKLMTAVSTRFDARPSSASSLAYSFSPAFTSAIGLPCMDLDLSPPIKQGARSSELRMNSRLPKSWIGGPPVE